MNDDRDGGRHGPSAAKLAALEGAVRDLGAQQRDLRDRMSTVLDLLEKLQERIGESGEEAGAVAWPALAPPEPRRSWPERLREAGRLAGWVLRAVVRRWREPAADPWPEDRVHLHRQGQVRALPRLAVVLVAEGRDDPALDRQTDGDFLRVVHDPARGLLTVEDGEEGRGRTDRAAGLGVDYLWAWPNETADVPPTLIETGRLILACEPLDFLCFEAGRGGARQSFVWVRPELWSSGGGCDFEALRALGKRSRGRVMGKVVGSAAFHLPAPPWSSLLRERLRRAGAYFVAARGVPRLVEHALAALELRPAPRGDEHGRPSVLLWIEAPLAGGLERIVATLLSDLGDEARFLVIVGHLDDPVLDELSVRRLRALRKLTPYGYDLAESFAPELWPEVAAYLAAAHDVSRVVHVGPGGGAAELRRRLPDLTLTALPLVPPDAAPSPAFDHYVAPDRPVETALVEHGVEAEQVLCLPPDAELEPLDPAGFPAARIAELRRELRLGSEGLVVVMASDLVAGKRPEDFVALAHRLRDDERFAAFLLVGEGPLAATLVDLGRCFALSRFFLEPPKRALAEYLAVADVVCTTAESEPFLHVPLAALALERPVVACAVGDLAEILATGPCGVTVPHAGDLDAFEAALAALTEPAERHALARHGRAAARRFSRPREALDTWRQALGLGFPEAGPADAARTGAARTGVARTDVARTLP